MGLLWLNDVKLHKKLTPSTKVRASASHWRFLK
jgi:hypothetical protein